MIPASGPQRWIAAPNADSWRPIAEPAARVIASVVNIDSIADAQLAVLNRVKWGGANDVTEMRDFDLARVLYFSRQIVAMCGAEKRARGRRARVKRGARAR